METIELKLGRISDVFIKIDAKNPKSIGQKYNKKYLFVNKFHFKTLTYKRLEKIKMLMQQCVEHKDLGIFEYLSNNKENPSVDPYILKLINKMIDIIKTICNEDGTDAFSSINYNGIPCKSFCNDILIKNKEKILKGFNTEGTFILDINDLDKSDFKVYSSDFKLQVGVSNDAKFDCALKTSGPISKHIENMEFSFIPEPIGFIKTPGLNFIISENALAKNINEIRKCRAENLRFNEFDTKEKHYNITQVISADTRLLRSLKLKNYSLLIGSNLYQKHEEEMNDIKIHLDLINCTLEANCITGAKEADLKLKVNNFMKFNKKGVFISKIRKNYSDYSYGIVNIYTEHTFTSDLRRALYCIACYDSYDLMNEEEYRCKFLRTLKDECFESD